jgi:hypothetical protein
VMCAICRSMSLADGKPSCSGRSSSIDSGRHAELLKSSHLIDRSPMACDEKRSIDIPRNPMHSRSITPTAASRQNRIRRAAILSAYVRLNPAVADNNSPMTTEGRGANRICELPHDSTSRRRSLEYHSHTKARCLHKRPLH